MGLSPVCWVLLLSQVLSCLWTRCALWGESLCTWTRLASTSCTAGEPHAQPPWPCPSALFDDWTWRLSCAGFPPARLPPAFLPLGTLPP